MQWLNELPFADNRVLQIGFLAACGIAALIVLAIVYRLAFANRLRVPGGRTRQPRLGLVDAFSLDGQRQLVLIRRDNIEHLVMIGGPNDVLVELQINRAAVPARETTQASPLLVPSTPVRQAAAAPASAVAEAPAKVAAKAPSRRPRPRRPPMAAPIALPCRPAHCRAARSRQASVPPAAGPKRPQPAPLPHRRPSAPSRPNRRAPASAAPRADASRGAGAASAAEFAAASGGAASRAVARGDAPADHPRQRLAEPRRAAPALRNRRPREARGNPRRASPVAPAPPRRPEKPEPAVGSKAEPAVRNGESGAGRGANGDRSGRPARPWPKRGPRRRRPRRRRRPTGRRKSADARAAGRQDKRRAERQAAAQSRRSVRRPRFARSGNGAFARPRKVRLTRPPDACGGRGRVEDAADSAWRADDLRCVSRRRQRSDGAASLRRSRRTRRRITRRDKSARAVRGAPAPRPTGSRSDARRGA